jgi:FemAB family protein
LIELATIPYAQNPQLWDSLLAGDPVQYPLGYPSDQVYSAAYAADWSYEDVSMLVYDRELPLAGLQVSLATGPEGQRALNFYGRPIFLRLNGKVDRLILEKAQKRLAEALLELHAAQGKPVINILEMTEDGAVSDFTVALLAEGAVAAPVYKQIIDLSLPEAELRRDQRKSYKSLITWGEKNLALQVYDSASMTPDIIERFRQLHIAVAGRETRSKESWDLQYRQVKQGEAFIIFGVLDNALVTAGLFLHSPSFCYYGVSASIREMFDKPLSHAVIWRAVMEAKKRGCQFMELGDLVHLYTDGYAEKEKNISMFKRGFGGKARLQLQISLPAR